MHVDVAKVITSHKAEISAACAQFGVEKLELFGSGTTCQFDVAASDLDFLVTFTPIARRRAFDNYFGLREFLEGVFGRPIDLVTEGSLRNPYLIREIAQSRELLYGSQA